MAVTLPPQKKKDLPILNEPVVNTKASEKKIRDVINRGGSITEVSRQRNIEKVELKGINVKFTVGEIDTIKALRGIRPVENRNSSKMSVSLHDWIVEAVQEKIKRDVKKYNLSV
jgi:hypothetical protein